MKNIDLVYNAVSSLRKLSDCTKWSIVFKTQVYMYLYQACSYYVRVNSKGAHAPPSPRLTPGHLTFFNFFGQIPHHVGHFFGQMPPSLGIF